MCDDKIRSVMSGFCSSRAPACLRVHVHQDVSTVIMAPKQKFQHHNLGVSTLAATSEEPLWMLASKKNTVSSPELINNRGLS